MNPSPSLQDILALLTLPACVVVFCIGVRIIYLSWKHGREQRRKWAEEGVKQSATREQKLYIEKP